MSAETAGWRKQELEYLKMPTRKGSKERYSINSWSWPTNAHNEYMKFLRHDADVTEAESSY